MLACLPAVVRQAFLLSQLEGLTYAEIASRMGVNSRTVKRYMAHAFEQCIQFVPLTCCAVVLRARCLRCLVP